MDTITLWELLLLAGAAALVGFSKTAISGANTVSLAVFAAVLPARESTGVILPILIAGDLLAVLTYRRHAHWPTLLRLFPSVAVGVLLGTVFLASAGDELVRISIGAVLLAMAALTLWRRRRDTRQVTDTRRALDTAERPRQTAATSSPGESPDFGTSAATGDSSHSESSSAEAQKGHPSARANSAPQPTTAPSRHRTWLKARSYGVLGGFTTMVANAAGPVMSLYLLSAGFRKLDFLGTSAWFFLIVNVSKVPFSTGLGLINADSLLLDAALVLFVIPGALLGRACVRRLNQGLFERIILATTILGGVQLLLG